MERAVIGPARSKAGAREALDDVALLARVSQGDVGALGEIYDRHGAALLAFLRRMSRPGDVDDAEDLLQATFVVAMRRASSFDPSKATTATTARPWLYGIALRVARDRRRSLKRFAAALVAMATSRGDEATDPRERTDVARALARLSEPKRVTLLLAEVEGFTGDEIAAMLGVSVGAIWTRLHHARREMRAFLEQSEQQDAGGAR
jgi:RNA polymerase sigma-70 factor (ECF subfamily)